MYTSCLPRQSSHLGVEQIVVKFTRRSGEHLSTWLFTEPVAMHLNSLVHSTNQQKIAAFYPSSVYSKNWITRGPWASEVLSCPFLRLRALRFINVLYQLVWNCRFFFFEQCTFFPFSYINVIMTVFNQRCLLTFKFDQLHFNSVLFNFIKIMT